MLPMHTFDLDGDVRIEFFVRDELPPPAADQAERVMKRLETFVRQGVVSGLTTDEWESRTPVGGGDPAVRDRYLAFAEWTLDSEFELTPFFAVRTCYSPECGGWDDWLVLPAMCLAVYVDDTLQVVYPHRSDSESTTVEEGVAQLERTLLDTAGQSTASAD